MSLKTVNEIFSSIPEMHFNHGMILLRFCESHPFTHIHGAHHGGPASFNF